MGNVLEVRRRARHTFAAMCESGPKDVRTAYLCFANLRIQAPGGVAHDRERARRYLEALVVGTKNDVTDVKRLLS
jgi:hypothetical protein